MTRLAVSRRRRSRAARFSRTIAPRASTMRSASLMLEGQLLRGSEALDRDGGLRRDRAKAQDIGISVRFRSIALHREHAEDAITRQDRDDKPRLRCDQLTGFGPIEKTDGRPFRGPSTDDLRRSRPNDLAREPLTERARAPFVFGPAVHLTDDLDGLARLVVEGEEEDRGIHHARRLVVESAEQLGEVARLGAERADTVSGLESRAEVSRGEGVQLLLTASPHRVLVFARRKSNDPGPRRGLV